MRAPTGEYTALIISRYRSGGRKKKEFLGPCPFTEYDTSIKLYRKVHKDCRLSYHANTYCVPYHLAGKKVMLKIKNGMIHIFNDQELVAVYQETQGKYTVTGSDIYTFLQKDRSQRERKYGKKKGRATRGLSTASLYPRWQHVPLLSMNDLRVYRGTTDL